MKTFPKTVSLVVFVLLAFAAQLFVVPSNASARWEDQSDELPGMDNDLTPILVVGGVLVAGFLVWKIVKGGGDDKQDNPTVGEEDDQDSPESPVEPGSEQEESTSSENSTSMSLGADINKPNLNLYFDIDPTGGNQLEPQRSMDLSDVTVKVGLSIGF